MFSFIIMTCDRRLGVLLALWLGNVGVQSAPVLRGDVEWIRGLNDHSRYEYLYGMDTDATGNLHLAASVSSYQLTIGTNTLPRKPGHIRRILVVDSDGNAVSSRYPDSGWIYPEAIDVNRVSGNVTVSGRHNRAALGGLVMDTTHREFLGVMDSNGVWIAAATFDCKMETDWRDVTSADNGCAYISGGYWEEAAFGTNISFPSISHKRGFVAKLGADGSWEWVLRVSYPAESGISSIRSVHAIRNEGIVVHGYTDVSAEMGGILMNRNNTSGAAQFIAKISDTGNVQWVRVFDGLSEPRSIHVDDTGQIFVAGDFPNGIPDLDTLLAAQSVSNAAFFVAKMNSTGQFTWVRAGFSSNDLDVHSIRTDNIGNIYLSGVNVGSATFGETTLESTTYKGFIARMSSGGEWQWAMEIPGSESGGTIAGVRSLVNIAPSSDGAYIGRMFQRNPINLGGSTVTNSPNSIDSFLGMVSTVDVLQPAIFLQPKRTVVPAGGAGAFTVQASVGSSFRWLRDGVYIGGEVGTSLSLGSLSRADQGNYWVEVWNQHGTNVSDVGRLHVLTPVRVDSLAIGSSGEFTLRFADPSGHLFSSEDSAAFTVQVSSNLVDWATSSTSLTDLLNGAGEFRDFYPDGLPRRFYRIKEE